MSEPKFTPGPWVTENGCKVIVSHSGVQGDMICEAPIHAICSMEYWEANAHLIAAAPELYDAIMYLLETGEVADLSEEAHQMLIDATKKARGEK